MCKPKHKPVYHGETMQLSAERSRCSGGFPWWTLWLIWPAIWLFKGLAALIGTLAVGTMPWTMLIAAALIGAGIALLIADRSSRDR